MAATTSWVDHFLIAMPSLDDPHFSRGVTLVCQHDDQGAMGLVLNHPSDLTMAEVLRQMDIGGASAELGRQPVLLGGPVQPDRGFVLHEDARDFGPTLRFGHGLAISTSREILEALARGEGPREFVMTLGYAGWGAGQLEHEIARNAWLTVPADRAIVFETPIERRWQAAAFALGVDISGMPDTVGHA
jgi:putative transcriptional regulator